MTTAYQCDRCGAWDESPIGRGVLYMTIYGRSMHADYPCEPDLCRDCKQDFRDFMEGSA